MILSRTKNSLEKNNLSLFCKYGGLRDATNKEARSSMVALVRRPLSTLYRVRWVRMIIVYVQRVAQQPHDSRTNATRMRAVI